MAISVTKRRTRRTRRGSSSGTTALGRTLWTTASKLGRTKLWMALLVFSVYVRLGLDYLARGSTPSLWFFILATFGPVAYILAQAHVDGKRLAANAEILKARMAREGGAK